MTRARRHAWLRGLVVCSTSLSFFYLNVAICQSIFRTDQTPPDKRQIDSRSGRSSDASSSVSNNLPTPLPPGAQEGTSEVVSPDGRVIGRRLIHRGSVIWWEFSTSGEFLYSRTFDENPDDLIWPHELPEGADYLWDTSTGARVCQFGERDAGDCVVAPGGDVAIDMRHDRDMELFDVSNAATSSPLPSTADTIGSVLFFANPGFLSYSRPNMWQSRSRVRFDSTGKYAITILQNGIRIWQCKPVKLMGDVPLRDWTGLCAISPSGKYAAIEPVREPDARGSVIVYDIASTPVRQLGQIELPGPMTGMTFLNDDCLLAVDTRMPVRTSVFDVRRMQEDASYSSVPGSEVQFARYITTGSKRRRQPFQNMEWSGALGKVRVLCVPNQDAIVMFKHSVPSVRCACFSPGGGVLYVGTEHQVVGLDVLTGNQLCAIDVGGDVCSIASSPKDDYVAAQTDREIVVLSIEECLRTR